MDKHLYIRKFVLRILILFIGIVSFSSCTTHKDYLYLRSDFDEIESLKPQIKINKGDLLHITVQTNNTDINSKLNLTGSQATTASESAYFINGYLVSDSGIVNVPLLGKMIAEGLTTSELESEIRKRLLNIIKDPLVSVRLLNYTITILGEVNAPGTHNIYRSNINILEALGLAGDITDFGNRRDILLLKKSKSGYVSHKIDLGDPASLASSEFNMLPGDVIYVKPMRTKVLRQNIPILSFIFATMTTSLLIANFFK